VSLDLRVEAWGQKVGVGRKVEAGQRAGLVVVEAVTVGRREMEEEVVRVEGRVVAQRAGLGVEGRVVVQRAGLGEGMVEGQEREVAEYLGQEA
jgi:hypothetical protein